MSLYEIVSCIISIFAAIVTTFAAIFTYKNLREIKKQFFEQNRGNLVFYIDQINPGSFYSLILKNYGNSPAKLLSLSIDPDIVWEKSILSYMKDVDSISKYKNIFLAPKQFIASDFDFTDYPDSVFNIHLKYLTCGQTIEETYTIDLHFADNIVSTSPSPNDEVEALKLISENIQWLSKRFL